MKFQLFSFLLLLNLNLKAQTVDVITNGLQDPAGMALNGNIMYISEAQGNKISCPYASCVGF